MEWASVCRSRQRHTTTTMWIGVAGRYWMLYGVAGSVYAFIYLIYVADATVSVLPEDFSNDTACRGLWFEDVEDSCPNGRLVVRDLYFVFKNFTTFAGTCYIEDVASVSDQCCVWNNTDSLVEDDDQSVTSIREMMTGESSPVQVYASDIQNSNGNSQYMFMNYYCIPKSQTVTTLAECSDNNSSLSVTDGSAIYLYNRNSFEECSCSVEVASCTSPLTVYTIVLDLYSHAGVCHHTVNITDGGDSQRLTCDDNTFYTVSNRTAASNYLLFLFTRTTAGTGGIWIGFTAPDGVALSVSCPAKKQAFCGDCGGPAAPENGAISAPRGTMYGQKGIYTCNQGYDLEGDDETTCLANITWSNATPQCIAVDCGAPAPLGNGTISTPNGRTYGQKGIYKCNQGYNLDGDNETTCLADGTWSNATPQCIAVDCGAPAAPENGAISTQRGTTYGQSGIYTCNQGYDLVGDDETTCLANITWSNATPQCVAVDCGAPAPLGNGTISTPNGRTYDQKGIYTCNQGYDLVGDNETTCLANGTWSNATPLCVAKNCGAPAPLGNGTISTPNGRTYGQKGIYTCNQGYDLVGNDETTCLANITWSNATPQCVAIGNDGSKMTTAIIIRAILVGVALAGTAAIIYIYWKKCKKTAVADKPRLHVPIRPDSAKWLPYPDSIILSSEFTRQVSTSKAPLSHVQTIRPIKLS